MGIIREQKQRPQRGMWPWGDGNVLYLELWGNRGGYHLSKFIEHLKPVASLNVKFASLKLVS